MRNCFVLISLEKAEEVEELGSDEIFFKYKKKSHTAGGGRGGFRGGRVSEPPSLKSYIVYIR